MLHSSIYPLFNREFIFHHLREGVANDALAFGIRIGTSVQDLSNKRPLEI